MDAATMPSRDTRRCARPGCADLAVATLAFRYDRQQAWLTTLVADKTPATYDLCGPCADRTAPPRGWELVDERPVLDALADPVDERDAVRDAIAAALRGGAPSPPALAAVPEAPLAAVPQPEVEAQQAPAAPEPVAISDPAPEPPTAAAASPEPGDVTEPQPAADAERLPAPVATDEPGAQRPLTSVPDVAPAPPSAPALSVVPERSTPRVGGLGLPPEGARSELRPLPERQAEAEPRRRRRRRRPVEVLIQGADGLTQGADGLHDQGAPSSVPSRSSRPGQHAPITHRLSSVAAHTGSSRTAPVAVDEPAERPLVAAAPAPAAPIAVPAAPESVPAAKPAVEAPRAVDVPLAFDTVPDRLVQVDGRGPRPEA